MKLIVITGIDGTGKTTLAKNLTETLSQGGIPAQYLYARIYPFLSRLIMFLGREVFLRRHNLNEDYISYDESKKSKMSNPVLASGYTLSILIDYFVQLWMKLLPRMLSRRVLVVDRYIYDTLINDLAVHLGYGPDQFNLMLSKMFIFSPQPDLTILLDVPEEIAFARKDDVVHIEYLKSRRKWYLYLESNQNVCKLDGTLSPDELTKLAVQKIINHYERKL